MRAPCLLLSCCAIFTLLSLRLVFERDVQPHTNETDSWPPLPDYCNTEAPTGREGELPKSMRAPYALIAVGIVIRHGDRSPIHSLPSNRSAAAWRCVPRAETEPHAFQQWPMRHNSAAAFVVRSLGSGAVLERSLVSAAEADGETCLPGQLTPRGVEQHLRLGHHLGTRYEPLIRRVLANASSSARLPLYARSTDYTRTLLSAASFVSGLLRTHGRPSAAAPLVLLVQVTDWGPDCTRLHPIAPDCT